MMLDVYGSRPSYEFVAMPDSSRLLRCSCSTVKILVSTVEKSIEAIGPLECSDVARILGALSRQMKVSGFSELDIQMIQEANDFVCGDAA